MNVRNYKAEVKNNNLSSNTAYCKMDKVFNSPSQGLGSGHNEVSDFWWSRFDSWSILITCQLVQLGLKISSAESRTYDLITLKEGFRHLQLLLHP